MPDYYATPGGAGLLNGLSWTNAFDSAALEAFIVGALIAAGDRIWLADGTYTFTADRTFAVSGSATLPILMSGVKAGTTNEPPVYSDWSRDAADRPFIDMATFQMTAGTYTIFRNIEMQGSDNYVLQTGLICLIENCSFDNDSAAAAKYALRTGGYTGVYNCEITSANCNGIYSNTSDSIKYCYIHDIATAGQGYGIRCFGGQGVYDFNIFDNCRVGLELGALTHTRFDNNTFYACATAINASTAFAIHSINNLLEGSTIDGYKWTGQRDINFHWRNHGDDARNNDMWDLVAVTPSPFADHEVTAGDPLFTTPGSDHSLQDGSPVIGDGMSITLGVG